MITELPQIESGFIRGAEAAHHLSVTLRAAFEDFYNRPVEIVTAEMNQDVSRTLAIFSHNASLATSTNEVLEWLNSPRFPVRAPTAMPNGYSFDSQAGQFVYNEPAADTFNP
jgi:hypothetical protein